MGSAMLAYCCGMTMNDKNRSWFATGKLSLMHGSFDPLIRNLSGILYVDTQ
jgi:hypothetical protein